VGGGGRGRGGEGEVKWGARRVEDKWERGGDDGYCLRSLVVTKIYVFK